MSINPIEIRISGPLAGFAQGYGTELVQLGYAPASVRQQMKVLADLSDWLLSHGMAAADLRRSDLDRFLRHRRAAGHTRYASIRAVRPVLDYLQRFEVVPRQAPDAVLAPVDVMLDQFWRYLTVERALAAVTARAYLDMVRPFIQGRLSADCRALNLERLTAADIISFMVTRCPRQNRGAAKLTVTALRSFLRFLHLDGVIEGVLGLCRAIGCRPAIARAAEGAGSRPSSTPVRVMRRHHAARLPGHRDSDNVRPSRYAVGRSSQAPAGRYRLASRRNHRSRQGELHRTHSTAPDVGRAVAQYLQRGRPVSAQGRTVFVRIKAPHRDLSSCGVSNVVADAAKRAGLGRIHAHRLRHTAAMQMLRAGASLPEIGQLLRHRRALTTAIYAKVDRDTLRMIARPWPGDAA